MEQQEHLLLFLSYSVMANSLWDCSMPGFPVLHSLLEFARTHVQWVVDAIQPSHPLLPPFLLLSVFHSIRVFSNELSVWIKGMERWKTEVKSLAKGKGRRWKKLKITNRHLRRGDVVGVLGDTRAPLEETRHEFNSSQLWFFLLLHWFLLSLLYKSHWAINYIKTKSISISFTNGLSQPRTSPEQSICTYVCIYIHTYIYYTAWHSIPWWLRQ